jgi:hypothetical protein
MSDGSISSKRQLEYPIGIDLVGRIERRNCTIQLGIPRIDDLVSRSTYEINALGIGAQINRSRICLVEIELHAMSHPVAQHELAGVIRAVADRTP